MFPVAHLDSIPLPAANDLLIAWNHRMGPLLRGNSGALHCHALFVHGAPVAIATTSSLICPNVGGGLSHLTRSNTVELSRLCAGERWACRVMLRLWREVVFPACGVTNAISYQDADAHTGNTYRLDGWKRQAYARGTPDLRSGRQGRNRWIWVWERGQ
jgi:antitoxin VapB